MSLTPPDAPPQTSGSADAAPERHVCEVCGREFKARIALHNHAKTHDLKPGEGPGVEPDIKVKRATKLSEKELTELQATTAEHIRTVGGVLHAALISLKVLKLQDPDARVRIPVVGVTFGIPAVDTHLPYVILSRSELTAKVLVEHAAQNETLLKWIVRINGWFEGGETGQLVGAHVAGAVMSTGVQLPLVSGIAGKLIEDVVDHVATENAELRHQVAQLQAQMAFGAERAPGDERGAGNGGER